MMARYETIEIMDIENGWTVTIRRDNGTRKFIWVFNSTDELKEHLFAYISNR
jgi:hypothetical protein